MTTTTDSYSHAGASLLSAVDAIRNVPALLLMFATLAAGALVWALAGMTSQSSLVLGSLVFLVGAALLFYGVNAVGMLLMDQAKGLLPRSIGAALAQSLATSHRLLLVLLLVAGVYLVCLLGLSLLLLICKIPLLGPLLFAVVFPLCVVLSGVAMFVLLAVVLPLAAPSVWDGASTFQAVSRLLVIARHRLIPVLMAMVLLFFIAGTVAVFVFGIMAWGSAITGTLAASVLGGGISNLISGLAGRSGLLSGLAWLGGDGASYLIAASIGGGVVYAMALSLPSLVYGRGCCQVYLLHIDTVDTAGFDARLRQGIAATQQRAEALRRQHLRLQSTAAEVSRRPAPALALMATLACPRCSAVVLPEARSCSRCDGKTV